MTTETVRKPILAVISALVTPGLGQVYNGQMTRGVMIFLIILVLMPLSPLPAIVALHSSSHLILTVILLFTAIALGIYIYSIFNAFRTAVRYGNSYTLKPHNRAYTYVIAFIVGTFIYLGVYHYTSEYLIQSIFVTNASMLPNIMPGDYIFVDKRVNCPTCKKMLQLGEVAIFYPPNGRHKLHIKRIIGMPGDRITIKGKDVSVNGVALRTTGVSQFRHHALNQRLLNHSAWREKDHKAIYTVLWKKGMSPQTVTNYTVPAGTVFVLGDNRSASKDSRAFGTVPMRDIVGEARQVWFSYSKNSGIRWWRVGRPIDAPSPQ